MRNPTLLLPLALCLTAACHDRGAPPAAIAPAAASPASAPPRDQLQVLVNGQPSAAWDPARLQRVTPLRLRNHEGEDRVAWPLRDVTRALVGASARVVALVNDQQQRVAVAPAEWSDPTRTLVMRPTHRGGYKVHWVDADGTSGEALLKGVRQIEIVQ